MQPVWRFTRGPLLTTVMPVLALALAHAMAPVAAVATQQAPAPVKPETDPATRARLERERADKDRDERDKADRQRRDSEKKDKDPEKSATPSPAQRGSTPAPALPDGKSTEERALSLVREQLPELAEVLIPLKTTHEAEYRKAIADLANDARALTETKTKNPARYPFALDSWRARTRVELVAAQLARSPSAEREQQLRAAIRQRVEADIRRHQFEVDQTELAVSRQLDLLKKAETIRDRARAALHQAEEGRDGRIEARFQALFQLTKKAETAAGPMPHPTTPIPHD